MKKRADMKTSPVTFLKYTQNNLLNFKINFYFVLSLTKKSTLAHTHAVTHFFSFKMSQKTCSTQ